MKQATADNVRILPKRTPAGKTTTVIEDIDGKVQALGRTVSKLKPADLTNHEWNRLSTHRLKLLDISSNLVPAPEFKGTARRRHALMAGIGLTVVGGLLGLFLLFEFFGSNLIHARGQSEMLASFKETLVKAKSTASAAPIVAGEPLGVLEIPALEMETVLIEGASPENLEQGPGHLRGTALPGRAGNAVIAGRRTTFGAPFRRLDELAKGDRIVVSSLIGVSKFKVTSKRIVAPGQPDVIGSTKGAHLTLITSHPEFLANKRLAVTAEFEGKAPRAIASAGPVVVGQEESGLAGDTSSLGPLVIWTELLLAALGGTWLLYRRWPRVATYLVTTPVILAILYVVFGQVNRLLPGTI